MHLHGDRVDDLGGRLIVAVPGILEDPNFRRTVVLVLEHGDSGALGLVLNRPLLTRVDEPFPGWELLAAEPRVLYEGGPVQHAMIVALGRRVPGAAVDGLQPISDRPDERLVTVDLRRDVDDLGSHVETLRVFAGYTGWSGGQLEHEIGQGAWWVCDALPSDAFTRDPSSLWGDVLRRQGGWLAVMARYPDDPECN